MTSVLEQVLEVLECISSRTTVQEFKNFISSRTIVQELHRFMNYSSRTSYVQELHLFKNYTGSLTVHEPKFLKLIIIIIIIKTLFQEGNTISTKLISLAALKYLQIHK